MPRSEDVFYKLRKFASESPSERKAAKESFAKANDLAASEAGALLTSGVFGTSTIEIFEGGYVRVAAGNKTDQSTAPITKKTPFEKLRSIKFTAPIKDVSDKQSSTLDGLVSSTVSSLIKGGANIVKASAPGLAAAGVAHLASAESRRAYLVISTDKATYSLTNESHNGFITRTNEGHKEIGLILESAGLSVLGLEIPPASSAMESDANADSGESDLAARLRELAKLHKDGILSDDEFAQAKSRLLEGL